MHPPPLFSPFAASMMGPSQAPLDSQHPIFFHLIDHLSNRQSPSLAPPSQSPLHSHHCRGDECEGGQGTSVHNSAPRPTQSFNWVDIRDTPRMNPFKLDLLSKSYKNKHVLGTTHWGFAFICRPKQGLRERSCYLSAKGGTAMWDN